MRTVGCVLVCLWHTASLLAAEEAVTVFQRVSSAVVSLDNVLGGGTGVLLKADGLILTNAHVVAVPLKFRCKVDLVQGGQTQTVVFQDVQIVGVHPTRDLALVRINPAEHASKLAPCQVAPQKAVTGQTVYAIGNPSGGRVKLTKTITSGLLSGVDRVIDDVSYYQISAPINPGNSGGPLCDREGRVLGLVTLKFTEVENVGFAIPLYDLRMEEFVPVRERKVDQARQKRLIENANRMINTCNEMTRRGKKDSPAAQLYRALGLQLLLEALVGDPANSSIYVACATNLRQLDEPQAAEEFLLEALQLFPWGRDSSIYRELGLQFALTKRTGEAEMIWLEGVAKYPVEGARIWEDLAILYRDRKDYARCAQCAGVLLFLRDARTRKDFVMAVLQLCRSKLPSAEWAKVEEQLRGVPADVRKRVQQAQEHLDRKALTLTPAFAEFIRQSQRTLDTSHLATSVTGVRTDVPTGTATGGTGGAVDLLAQANLEQGRGGAWRKVDGAVLSPTASNASLELPGDTANEYDLTLEVERRSERGMFVVGFPRRGVSSLFLLDAGGTRSGLSRVSTGLHQGAVLPQGQRVSLTFQVRENGLTVLAGGQQIFQHASDAAFPAAPDAWQVRDGRRVWIGAADGEFAVYAAKLPGTAPTPSVPTVATRPPVAVRPPRTQDPRRAPPANDREIARFPDMRWGVQSLAYSPQGLLAAGKMDRALWIFDVAGRRRVDVQEKLEDLRQVTCCAFTPDGKQLLSGGGSGLIAIWTVTADGRLTRAGEFAGHSQEIHCITISRDGRCVLSGGRDKRPRYWELATRREQWAVSGLNHDVRATHLAADSATGMAFDGKDVVRFTLTDGKVDLRQPLGFGSTQSAAFSPDGRHLVWCDGNELRTWDVTAGTETPRLDAGEMQWYVTFTNDGKFLLSGGSGKFSVWDFAARQRTQAITVGEGIMYVQSIAVSPDGTAAAAIPNSAGQTLQVFSLKPK
jgi:WD40 repeat protein